MDKKFRYATLFLSCANLTLFLVCFVMIVKAIHRLPIPFDTDEADHANAAIELFYGFQSASFSMIAEALRRQAFYPPLYSIFVSLSYALFSPTFFSSRLPAALSFLASGFVLAFAVWRSAKDAPQAVRLLGASMPFILMASSALMIENSALCMIELFAVLITSLLFLIPANKTVSLKSAISIALLISISFFSKYNFGILIIAGAIGAFWIKPPLIFTRDKKEFLQSIIILSLFGALLGGWFLVSYPESIVHFFVGHPSYSPLLSSDNLLFELTAWFKEYSPNSLTALLTLILGLWGAYAYREIFPVRLAYAITGASFTILLLSTTNESRHFIVAAPCIWYLCSLGSIDLMMKKQRPVLIIPTLLMIGAYTGSYTLIPHIERSVAQAMEGDISYADLQDGVFSHIDSTQPALFIGVSDQFGIEALKWQGARYGHIPYTKVQFDSFPYRDEKNFTALKRQRTLAAPYRIEKFPKVELEEVLKQHHYRALILIRTIGERDSLASTMKSLKEQFAQNITYQKTANKTEVTVIKLPGILSSDYRH